MPWPPTRANYVNWGLIALCIVCVLAYLRFAPNSMKPWTNAPQPAVQVAEPKVVTKIKRVLIPGPVKVVTIEKIKYIEKMPRVLTPSTVQDNTAHVIASAIIPPSPAGGTASAILQYGTDNTAFGRIEWKPAMPSFFALQKEFGVRVGTGMRGLIIGEIYARPARVGPVTVEVRGWGKRDDRNGADFGGAILADYRF